LESPSAITKLSKRQKLLIRKLHVLGNRAKEEILPVKIYEIVGFGSFFRLKERPGDVDLLIKYSNINSIYDLFKQIMDNVVELYKEDPEKFSMPIDALANYINVHRNSLPFLSEYVNVFCSWIENITWGMISRQYPQNLAYNYEDINKKSITKKFAQHKNSDGDAFLQELRFVNQ
jgi:hypothetical protein